jgi:hypothetical protein
MQAVILCACLMQKGANPGYLPACCRQAVYLAVDRQTGRIQVKSVSNCPEGGVGIVFPGN